MRTKTTTKTTAAKTTKTGTKRATTTKATKAAGASAAPSPSLDAILTSWRESDTPVRLEDVREPAPKLIAPGVLSVPTHVLPAKRGQRATPAPVPAVETPLDPAEAKKVARRAAAKLRRERRKATRASATPEQAPTTAPVLAESAHWTLVDCARALVEQRAGAHS